MSKEYEKIEIKSICKEDLHNNKTTLINLLKENYITNFPGKNNLEIFTKHNYKDMIKFSNNNSAILIGAYKNSRIVGFLWAHKKIFLSEKRMHVGHIVVDSKIRGRGVGTKLMSFLENLSIQLGIFKIDLMATYNNKKTLNFYKFKGFNISRVQLEKKLGDINDN